MTDAAVGHFLAMARILLPFSIVASLVTYERPVRLVAAAVVTGMGVYLLLNRRHPRFLARVAPHRLVLWSFLAATAHGAGLMLLPIFLRLEAPGRPCRAWTAGPEWPGWRGRGGFRGASRPDTGQ